MAEIIESLKFGPASAAQISEFEAEIGAKLPDDYRQFLLDHNGGRPTPDAFLFLNESDEQEEDIVECFFPMREGRCCDFQYDPPEQLPNWPLHCAWEDLQADLEELYESEPDQKLLPVGTDGSGNYFCLVLDGDQRGSVVFFEHEWGRVSPLADSFSAFLDGLREREREDYGS